MEHSVCKVSLAHHTKEWLSALFEALDGLELSVNNYLFTLLWIACRNKCLSHHLCLHIPHITTYFSAQNGGTGNGDTLCVHIGHFCAFTLSFIWMRSVSCQFSVSWIFRLTCLSSASQTEKSCWNCSPVRWKYLLEQVLHLNTTLRRDKKSSPFSFLFITVGLW